MSLALVAPLFLLIGLVSCGGGSKTTTTTTADYSITVSPTTATLAAGGSGAQLSVTAAASGGFSSAVTVTITGLPAGVTASPTSLTLTPGTAQSVTLTAAASAAAASANVTLTGVSGSLTHSATAALTVTAATPAADFSLSVSPTSANVTAGATGTQVSVLATPANSFTGTVSVAITGLPAGVTASPASLTLTPGTAQTVTLTAAATAGAASANVTFTGVSGALSHTAALAVTVTAASAANFSLSLSPTSLAVTDGAVGGQVSVLATATNGFAGSVAVAITGLPTGVTASPASLTLTPGTAQATTLTAAAGTAASTATVTFTGTSGTLSQTAMLALTVKAATATSIPDVTTYHYDNARDGLNSQETTLTPANVNSTQFGKIAFDTVDGKVDAEPLYLANVTAGGSARNVLYVASEHDSVYAFDADTGAQIWKTSILGTGETTSDDHSCAQITPEIGITSTPVIDRTYGTNGALFTVGMTKDSAGHYHQRLHALDITTGAEITGSPTEISATYPGTGDNSSNGNVVFNPGLYAERIGLLLLNGTIYTGWTSHCDGLPYTGWIMGYSEATLKQTQVLNLTPNGSQGSLWMSGDGIAADSSGNLYLLDANGTFDTTLNASGFPSKGDFGNAMLRLTTTNGTLAVADYFETYNTVTESDDDKDLGSGGEILLPPQTDANGASHNLLVGAGKDGNIYIGDTSNLGKYTPTPTTDANIYQVVMNALPGGVWGTPAFYNGVLYYGAAYNAMKAFPMTNAKLATTASSQTTVAFGFPGTTPSVSANGTQNGIVWTVESNQSSAAVLHAYDPTNLATEYYNSSQAASGRDSFGNGNKFITPLIVNGKVYVGTQTGVAVFGLLGQ